MVTLGDNIKPKIQPKYYCNFCDYGTNKKTNYDTHIMSIKHKKVTESYNKGQNSAEIQPKFSHKNEDSVCKCSCGKQYKHRQGLWRHKKLCSVTQSNNDLITQTHVIKNDINIDKELMFMIINQNKELLEIVKNGTHNTNSNNTHTNTLY